MFANVVAVAALMAGAAQAQVTATGTMGVTNPTAAVMGTPVNQTSMSRLISLNSIDDFCLFAPPEPNSVIGNTEAYEVAWCMKERNNARLIPDGTFTAVHFVKTPMYWQIQGLGDLTKLNIAANDEGGELDPHGATGDGNPVGGNVTTNATGSDVSYEEWMNYMSYNMFCLRICINQEANVTAAQQCQHTLDEMGCNWVMPGDYTDNSFTECDADAAYPPGWYPQPGGSISTFAQRYTGTYTSPDGATALWTVGETVTPQTPYSIPASSNCITYSGINYAAASAGITASGASSGSASASGSSASATGSASSGSGASASGSKATGSAGASGTASAGGSGASASKSGAAHAQYSGPSFGPMVAGFVSVVAVVAGALLV